MTHDKKCKFDPQYCRDCLLQKEAREDERKKWQSVINSLRDDLNLQRKATRDNFELLQKLTRKTGNNA